MLSRKHNPARVAKTVKHVKDNLVKRLKQVQRVAHWQLEQIVSLVITKSTYPMEMLHQLVVALLLQRTNQTDTFLHLHRFR
jgi:hypothetical protein